MTNFILWVELLSKSMFIPFLLGIGLGIVWSVKIKKYRGPRIKIMYETDIDSV